MKMEQTECSETSAHKIQTPGNYPEESIQHSEHGERLKSKILATTRVVFQHQKTSNEDLFSVLNNFFCVTVLLFVSLFFIQICIAYRRGYGLRNASLGDFVVVRTP